MGACISSDLAVGPDFYLPTIPADIVQMTTESSKEELAEFTALISASFCGSRNKAPDAALSWCYDPKSAVDGFLKEDPSEERTIFFDFLAAWCLHTCLRHGGCFVLKKDGKMVSAAATIPPNDKKLHDAGICEQMKIMSRTGISNLPKEMEQPRMVELGNVMKKAHNDIVPGRHLYVYAFATSIEHQGKGYGRELMQFLCDSAGKCLPLFVLDYRNVSSGTQPSIAAFMLPSFTLYIISNLYPS